MLIPYCLWGTIQQQENHESVKEKTREPATPPPCPEGRTVTPQHSPSTPNTRDDSSARATDQAGDHHDTCGTRLTCDTCGRRDSSHARDTSVTRDTRDACDTSRACDSCDTSGTSFPCAARSARDTSFTCDTSLSHDALSTQDSTGAGSTGDARGTRDTCLASDTSGAHGTHDPHATVARDTRGTCDTCSTHDVSGNIPEGTHRPPDGPDAGSSTLVGQPEKMSTVTRLASPR